MVLTTTNSAFQVFASGASSNITYQSTNNGQTFFIGITGTQDTQLQLVGDGTGTHAVYVNAPNGGLTAAAGTQGFTCTSGGTYSVTATGAATINSSTSISIGSDGGTATLNLGFDFGGRIINMGTSNNTVNVYGAITLNGNSSGVGINTNGPVNIMSGQAAAGSITINAAAGGLTVSSGSSGY